MSASIEVSCLIKINKQKRKLNKNRTRMYIAARLAELTVKINSLQITTMQIH